MASSLSIRAYDESWTLEIPKGAISASPLLKELEEYSDDEPVICLHDCSKDQMIGSLRFITLLPTFYKVFKQFDPSDVRVGPRLCKFATMLRSIFKSVDQDTLHKEVVLWLGASPKAVETFEAYARMPEDSLVKVFATKGMKPPPVKETADKAYFKKMYEKGHMPIVLRILDEFYKSDHPSRRTYIMKTLLRSMLSEGKFVRMLTYMNVFTTRFGFDIEDHPVLKLSMLEDACMKNDMPMVKHLYETLFEPTMSGAPSVNTIMYRMCSLGKFEPTRFLLSKVLPTIRHTRDMNRLLECAGRSGNVSLMKYVTVVYMVWWMYRSTDRSYDSRKDEIRVWFTESLQQEYTRSQRRNAEADDWIAYMYSRFPMLVPDADAEAEAEA